MFVTCVTQINKINSQCYSYILFIIYILHDARSVNKLFLAMVYA